MIAYLRTVIAETNQENLLKTRDDPEGYEFLLSVKRAIRLRFLKTIPENPPNDSKTKTLKIIPTSLHWAYC